MMATAMKT